MKTRQTECMGCGAELHTECLVHEWLPVAIAPYKQRAAWCVGCGALAVPTSADMPLDLEEYRLPVGAAFCADCSTETGGGNHGEG